MRRRYIFEVECRLRMIPANAKGSGKAAETVLASHQQEVVFTGEPGGKVGQYGDADHLGQLMETCEASAKISTRATVAKAHEFLTTQHPETSPAAAAETVQDLGPVGKAPADEPPAQVPDTGPDQGDPPQGP